MTAVLALDYARRGWAVFPIFEARRVHDGSVCACGSAHADDNHAGKHPRLSGGLLKATTDPAIIRDWWRRWPHANIGINCGMSGLVVIDVDPRHGGTESLRDLQTRLGPLPETVTALTGGDGEHHLYRAPADRTIKSSSSVLAPGIDIKASGGYIVAAGSRHISGKLYRWDAASGPDDIDLAELPAAWLERLATARAATDPPRADVPIPERCRNNELTRLAGGMRRYGFAADAIEAALLVTNASRCIPPLDDDEVAGIAESVGRYDPVTPCSRRQRVLRA